MDGSGMLAPGFGSHEAKQGQIWTRNGGRPKPSWTSANRVVHGLVIPVVRQGMLSCSLVREVTDGTWGLEWGPGSRAVCGQPQI